MPIYVPLSDHFIHGQSPYFEVDTDPRSPFDEEHWYPKIKFQEKQISDICKTGPGVAKTLSTSIEAHANYSFFFKWGGCTKQLENIINPCDQRHYPVPNNFLEETEIQDPNTNPQNETWSFDFRRDIITPRAAQRILKDSKLEMSPFTDTRLSAMPTKTETIQTLQESDETSSEEEAQTELVRLQFRRYRRKQHKLQQRLKQLIRQTPHITI